MLSSWIQDDLLVGGVRLHYCRTGSGDKPSLVLVHGFSDSGLCWSRTARDLESEYDVVMPDMRGHGMSARMRPGDEVDMAADLAGLIRGLGLHRPIVGGHSMGAMVTYELGARFPEVASALVLEDPPWWLERPPLPHGQPIGTWAREMGARTEIELAAQCRVEHPNWSEELVGLWAASKKQLDPAIIDTLLEKVDRVATGWQGTIAGLTPPTLLVTGNPALGGIVTPEVEGRICELNAGVTIVKVPNVGHLIRYDDYPAFMDALKSFLEQIAS